MFDSLKATTKTKKVMQWDSRFWDKKYGIQSDSKRIKSDSKHKSLVNKQRHTFDQHKAAFLTCWDAVRPESLNKKVAIFMKNPKDPLRMDLQRMNNFYRQF